jgi:two-component system sensor histidine kinase RpfC
MEWDRALDEGQSIKSDLRSNPEFQSALIRLTIWVFAAAYIGLGGATNYYQVDHAYYFWLFGAYLFIFLGILVSVLQRPVWEARRYFGVLVDVSATSFSIFLTSEGISPFYLLYIWIFVSYGTRYGKHHLMAASALSVLAYTIVLVVMGEWWEHTFEAIFFLLLLLVLPLYQYSLLRQLHEAKLAAEDASKAKGEFLSAMTHELRTPLSGILGMAQLLESTRLKPEQDEYVESILASTGHLGALIHDVLDVSKIEGGMLQLEHFPLDFRRLVRGVCSGLSAQALDKELELICWVDSTLPETVKGDELRLRQIMYNLVGNAIKFTDHGEVLVRARSATADQDVGLPHIYMEVTDTGIGIPEEKLDQVFNRFWQADLSSTRYHGGSGLGTTIAKDLVLMMGGAIGVESVLGQGTTFWVKLPLLEESASSPLLRSPADLNERRILVFETNPTSLAAISDACGAVGVEVGPIETISALSEAISRVCDGARGDLAIIADSPRGQDVERIAMLFKEYLGPNFPIIYLGYNSRRSAGRRCSCCQLSKPFTSDQLWRVLESTLQLESGEEEWAIEGQQGIISEDGDEVRVLLAEDNEINAKVISTLLADVGCLVTLAQDGLEALELTQEREFDIAFVDLHMPRMDGFEFTRSYRKQEQPHNRLPIIALTVNSAEEKRAVCLEAGMDDFLNKPVESDVLLSMVEQYAVRKPQSQLTVAV